MSACVSPPQDSVSHIVQVAAIIAAAASTAFPPFWKIIAPAVAASGLPVIASHFFAWSGGLFVAAEELRVAAAIDTMDTIAATTPAARANPLPSKRLLGAFDMSFSFISERIPTDP